MFQPSSADTADAAGATEEGEASTRRPVRSAELAPGPSSSLTDGIADIYAGRLDVIVVRGAFHAPTLAEAGERLDADAPGPAWARPNVKAPLDDVRLLGTDAPATPTFQAPRGVSLDAYLASSAAHAGATSGVFRPGFDAESAIRGALGRFAGGRPVEVARADDGRRYVPYTLRRLVEGTQLSVHHDMHYGLDLYRQLARQVDTRTLVSFVATLRAPLSGGELVVYGATSDAADLPRQPGGFAYDLPAIEQRYERGEFRMQVGDMFLLAAGRCLHRVERIVGPRARITMGGFLALDAAHQRVLFWS